MPPRRVAASSSGTGVTDAKARVLGTNQVRKLEAARLREREAILQSLAGPDAQLPTVLAAHIPVKELVNLILEYVHRSEHIFLFSPDFHYFPLSVDLNTILIRDGTAAVPKPVPGRATPAMWRALPEEVTRYVPTISGFVRLMYTDEYRGYGDEEEYDWRANGKSWVPPTGLGVAVVNNTIFVCGGGRLGYQPPRIDSTVRCLDLNALTNRNLPDLLSRLESHQTESYLARSADLRRRGLELPPERDGVSFWSESALTTMAIPRAHFAIATIGTRVYVFGGWTINDKQKLALTDSAACFDSVTKRWSNLPALPGPRAYCRATVLHHLIFIFGAPARGGGRDREAVYETDGESHPLQIDVFDTLTQEYSSIEAPKQFRDRPALVGCPNLRPDGQKWVRPATAASATNKSAPAAAAAAAAASALGGCLLLIAGRVDEGVVDFKSYSKQAVMVYDYWSPDAAWAPFRAAPKLKHDRRVDPSALVTSDGRVWLIGGMDWDSAGTSVMDDSRVNPFADSDRRNTLATLEVYDPAFPQAGWVTERIEREEKGYGSFIAVVASS